MAAGGTSVPSTFETITERLDPEYSYMIFEKSSGRGEARDFREVVEILDKLSLRIHSREFLPDDARKKLLLVVRLDPGRADEVLHEFVKEGLPKGVNLYAYGSSSGE